MIKFIKKFTMPIAIFVGMIGYNWFWRLGFLTPYLIFTMLFLTFSKINLSNLKPTLLHLYLAIIQIVFSTAIFFLLKPVNLVWAQGVMICIICPTATAGAVITKRLSGNMEFVASYTLYINLIVAMFIPIIFPLMKNSDSVADISFLSLFVQIFAKIFPLLVVPFLLALVVKLFPKINKIVEDNSGWGFYIWCLSLIIVVSDVIQGIVINKPDAGLTIMLAIGALLVCLIQFFVGKLLGKRYGYTIASGQALGQKNTVFAIWLASTYFSPIVAIAAGAYVIWQNTFNSVQIYLKEKQQM